MKRLRANSEVYEFLCLFKIAEGIRNRRAQLAAAAKTNGQKLSRLAERVPSATSEFVPYLNAIYATRRQWDDMALGSVFIEEALGRKFGDLMKAELNDLRNDVAHALSDDTGTIGVSADTSLHVARVRKWLPLMKVIVRRMLKNEFPVQYLPFLNEDGTLTLSSVTRHFSCSAFSLSSESLASPRRRVVLRATRRYGRWQSGWVQARPIARLWTPCSLRGSPKVRSSA